MRLTEAAEAASGWRAELRAALLRRSGAPEPLEALLDCLIVSLDHALRQLHIRLKVQQLQHASDDRSSLMTETARVSASGSLSLTDSKSQVESMGLPHCQPGSCLVSAGHLPHCT